MGDYWTFVAAAFSATGLVLGGLLWSSLRSLRRQRLALRAAEDRLPAGGANRETKE